MPDDKLFMKMALRLAKRGLGKTSPNPMVGAVIVKDAKIIGRGFHKKAGLAHAEAEALKEAGVNAKGAALYVNLEPCNHFGKTPPCTEAIIKSGIKKIVAAMKDPNPLNNGKGFGRLEQNGIKVVKGVMENEAKRLNEAFIKFITTKTPFVIAKAAQSLDGKIATRTGDSTWISGGESRRYVHKLRSQVDAVMVGVGTVVRDDPLLTCRIYRRNQKPRQRQTRNQKQPVKVVVDSSLKTPDNAKIFSKDSTGKVILATTKRASRNKVKKFKKIGAEVLILKGKKGRVDLKMLMRELGKREIASVLVEGGGELIGGLVEEKLIDKFLFFIAPKIIGGKDAITSVEGKGIEKVTQAMVLKDLGCRRFGQDLLIESYPSVIARPPKQSKH